MWKYLPRVTDKSAYFDVSTGEPVTINEGAKRCPHARTTWFSAMDKRDSDMQVYEGQCCVACGYLVSCTKRD